MLSAYSFVWGRFARAKPIQGFVRKSLRFYSAFDHYFLRERDRPKLTAIELLSAITKI
ncbi:MAG: hypothetical protein ACRC6M_04065 [Microcystaceae cyanobacterium]